MQRWEAKLEKLRATSKEKDENKAVALGTSKVRIRGRLNELGLCCICIVLARVIYVDVAVCSIL